MNSSLQKPFVGDSGSVEFENTLRLIAHLSAPEGLEERVEVGLRAAPRTASGNARILAWLEALRPARGWMRSSLARSAAAAAIVAVVVGGGWGVYSRVQLNQPARVIAVPQRGSAPGGFSSAGAMRTPQTLNGPMVVLPVVAAPQTAKPTAKTPVRRKRLPATNTATPQPSAPPVQ
jgi:hypothetical protein